MDYITERTEIDPETGCWVWQLALNKYGYGKAWWNKKTVTAHRLSYKYSKGDPGDLCVLHKCGNRKCCNPGHLYAGTHKQNSEDRVKDGTGARGRSHGMTKLCEEQVVAIRKLLEAGETCAAIGKQFSISESTVRHIKKRRVWAWL